MGFGYRRSLARDWSMTAEVGWRSYGSDYLDDTSGDYVDALGFGGGARRIGRVFFKSWKCTLPKWIGSRECTIKGLGYFCRD